VRGAISNDRPYRDNYEFPREATNSCQEPITILTDLHWPA